MLSVSEKFLLTLKLSDEGIEMMMQRVKRENPSFDEKKIRRLLRLEISEAKDKKLPKSLTSTCNV